MARQADERRAEELRAEELRAEELRAIAHVGAIVPAVHPIRINDRDELDDKVLPQRSRARVVVAQDKGEEPF